jgi:2-methylisocitrate lyase-like PEP mutase family enzyme
MRNQAEKAAAFRALHEREGAFIIPNPWDVGSARLLANLGFEALATTSAGFAFSIGKRDNTVGRDAVMEHARAIASATDLPVSADLENGFGEDPETVAETFRLASATGLSGGSIEDSTGRPDDPLYDLGLAAERVRAAVEAVRSLPFLSRSPGARRITCGAARISKTRSSGCRPIRRPGRTCSMRQVSGAGRTSPRWSVPSIAR